MSSQGRKSYFRKYFDERFSSNLEAYHQDCENYLAYCYQTRLSLCLKWLEESQLAEHSNILDVGCGSNPLVHEAVKLGYRAWGMDQSFGMLKNSHVEFQGKFVQGDADVLPFADESFDVVFCLGVLCYLPSDEIAMKELSRVVRKGGVLILSLPQKFNLSAMLDIPFYLKNKLSFALGLRKVKSNGGGETQYTEKSYTISHINRGLESAGFVPEVYRTIRFGPITLMGRELFGAEVMARISRIFESLHWVPYLKNLGEWYVVKARRKE